MRAITIQKNTMSEQAIRGLLNSDINPTLCGLISCADQRNDVRYHLWGSRGDEQATTQSCARAVAVIETEIETDKNSPWSKSFGLMNIGMSGSRPTVMDRSEADPKPVYELSGWWVADKINPLMLAQYGALPFASVDEFYTATGDGLLDQTQKLRAVLADFQDFLRTPCSDEGMSRKAIVTYAVTNALQEKLWEHYYRVESLDHLKVTQASQEELLGLGSLHPDRFQVTETGVRECTQWDKEVVTTHDPALWHDATACTHWADKTMLVLDLFA
jgi:hypothetical protein